MQNQPNNQIHDRTLRWMRECLALTRKKTAALMQHDLAAIEECLDAEGILVAQWAEVATAKRFATPGDGEPGERTLVRESLKALVVELKAINQRNAVLTRNGLDFFQTLLGVIRPPATYTPLAKGEATSPALTRSIISVEC